MWELTVKKAECQRIDAFELWCWRKTLESPVDCKEIQPVNPKGNQSWIFIGRTDTDAEAPILWPPDAKTRLIRKDPDAGKDWRQEEKGVWDGWMPSLIQWTWVWVHYGRWWKTGKPVFQVCCSLWFCKELDTTEWLKNNNNLWNIVKAAQAQTVVLKLCCSTSYIRGICSQHNFWESSLDPKPVGSGWVL